MAALAEARRWGSAGPSDPRDSDDVDVEYAVPLVVVGGDVADRSDTGVVHEDVDAAEAGAHGADGIPDRAGVPDVALKTERPPLTRLPDVSVVNGDLRPALGHQAGGRGADAAAAAGDDGNQIPEVIHQCRFVGGARSSDTRIDMDLGRRAGVAGAPSGQDVSNVRKADRRGDERTRIDRA